MVIQTFSMQHPARTSEVRFLAWCLLEKAKRIASGSELTLSEADFSSERNSRSIGFVRVTRFLEGALIDLVNDSGMMNGPTRNRGKRNSAWTY